MGFKWSAGRDQRRSVQPPDNHERSIRISALLVLGLVAWVAISGLSDQTHRADRSRVVTPDVRPTTAANATWAAPAITPLLALIASTATVTPTVSQVPTSTPQPLVVAPTVDPVSAAPALSGPARMVRGVAGCQRVALIFNIGSGFENRTQILDALKADGVPATLFPMGWWAEENPDLLRNMAADGFPIGSHGDQSIELTTLSDDTVLQDIRNAEATLERSIGQPILRYFTPYAAATDDRVHGLINRAGYTAVGWEVPAADWDYGVTADEVLAKVLPNIYDGAIVELHLDAPASAQSTEIALPQIIEQLRAEGVSFRDDPGFSPFLSALIASC